MQDSDGNKYLTAGRLSELLAAMPSDVRIIPNAVGNLLVQDPKGEMNLAFIDFLLDGDITYF